MLKKVWHCCAMWAACGCVAVVIHALAIPSTTSAQETPTDDSAAQEQVESTETPGDSTPPDSGTETAEVSTAANTDVDSDSNSDVSSQPPPLSGAAADSPNERFYELFEEWKSQLKQLRDIRAEYLIAEEDKLAELQQSWDATGLAAAGMLENLKSAGLDAYRAAPNSDREIVRFLVSMLQDFVTADNYPPANELADALIEGESEEKELQELAGLAAYGTNDFAATEEHLKQAEESGTISDKGSTILQSIEETREQWAAEVALREAEAGDNLPQVRLQTDAGDVVVELFENEAPETVGNFISLVEKGFYDQLTFHRVLPGFMAQGGCPDGDGRGGPGYNIYCECVNDNHRNHFAGSLSMAKSMAVNTGGSQFFLTFQPTPNLNGKHTVFGRIIEGWETLPQIVRQDPESDSPQPAATKIIKAEVVRKRDHEYRPNKVK